MFSVEFIDNFNKFCSVIKSCKTEEQLNNAFEWAVGAIKKWSTPTSDNAKKNLVNKHITDVYLEYIFRLADEQGKSIEKEYAREAV